MKNTNIFEVKKIEIFFSKLFNVHKWDVRIEGTGIWVENSYVGEINKEDRRIYLWIDPPICGGHGKNWKEYVEKRINPVLKKGGELPPSVVKAPWGQELMKQLKESGLRPYIRF